MFSRSIGRSLFGARISAPFNILPPVYLLPFSAKAFNSTTPIVEHKNSAGGAFSSPFSNSTSKIASEALKAVSSGSTLISQTPPIPTPAPALVPTPTFDQSLKTLLPLLRSQPPFYISAHIHSRPYVLTVGDTVRLPFLMHNVIPGDILRLNRASVVGSRDYTLKAPAGSRYMDERLFECRARVIGVES